MTRSLEARCWLRLVQPAMIVTLALGGACPRSAWADEPPVRAAAALAVNTAGDWPDDAPGDGICSYGILSVCSLRAAIMEANALPGDDTITVPAYTIVLSISGRLEDNARSGDLDITSNIELIGAGFDRTVVDGDAYDTVFDVRTGATAVISGLTIRDGSPGGVKNDGTLTIADSLITGNHSSGGGGGISNGNAATLVLQDMEVSANVAGLGGGGIDNRGRVSLHNIAIVQNTAARNGGGLLNNTGTVELTRSIVANNAAGGNGGGVWNDRDLVLTESGISSNRTTAGPNDGGGLYNSGTARLNRSLLTENETARDGGNIFNTGRLELATGEVSAGRAASGGGISNRGEASLVNVTVSGNTAADGGGWHNNVAGTQAVNLLNVTIAGNTGTTGAGISNLAGAVTLRNTIVADSLVGESCTGSIASAGNNLDSGNSCGLGGPDDRVDVDPRLAPLAANGSRVPVRSHALLSGSPAVDGGGSSGCPLADQRDRPRPQDGNGDGAPVCDIGAYEADPPPAPPSRKVYLPVTQR